MISKYAPKRKKSLINKNDIKEPLKLIDGTDDYYITPSAKVYRKYENQSYYLRKPHLNKRNGYLYIILSINNKHQTFRLHRLVALAWIPNPNNYPLVGHKNNIKSQCEASNLYWTTESENIQKAVNDGLLVNDKSYDDSQSKPIIVYDKNMNEIMRFGSACECHKKLKISKSTIARHCKHQIKTTTRCGYYFRYQNP